MNIFTKHPREQHFKSWWKHCRFAFSIGIRLLITSLIFILHGIFPFITIPNSLNFTESIKFLKQVNEYLARRKHG